jgi:hypothetical protein
VSMLGLYFGCMNAAIYNHKMWVVIV